MNRVSITLMSFLTFFMFSCKSSQVTKEQETMEKLIWVNSARVSCTGVAPMTCFQIQEGEEIKENEWQFFYDEIRGFDYRPGNIYRLKIKAEKRPEPIPADASSMIYSLVEVISEEPDLSLRVTDIWKLEKLGEIENPVGMKGALTLELNATERRYFAYAGCNTFRGAIVSLGVDDIRLGNGAATMMACPEPFTQIERDFSNMLQKVRKYKIEKRRLYLYGVQEELLAVFLKVD